MRKEIKSPRYGIMKPSKLGENLEAPDGVYDSLITARLLTVLDQKHEVVKEDVTEDELERYLSQHVASVVSERLDTLGSASEKIQLVNRLLAFLNSDGSKVADQKILRGVIGSPVSRRQKSVTLPEIPLSELALLTNAKGDPSIGSELPKELVTADRVDILMAFVKVSGLNKFFEALKELSNSGIKVRLITSTYIGATEKKALDILVQDLNVEVKVDYLARANRLHAKAWLLKRETGFSTAYVGSSNMSNPAMSTGLEWNVRLTESRTPEVLEKIESTFESYWNSESFGDYLPERDAEMLEEALYRARGYSSNESNLSLSMLDVRPYPHQVQMISELDYARKTLGFHKNLVVAATGSGKTVLAAFDFKVFLQLNPGARLLFVAHRKEILSQSRSTFAQVLGDSNFGELMFDGHLPSEWNHVFASVQSLSESKLQQLEPTHFDFVIIDEFHHASAPTYRRLIEKLKPKELVGLTATPERADGTRVQDLYFDGRIATELRLWAALDQELLSPFAYYGIGEETDFSRVPWQGANGYETKSLSNVVTGNDVRDRLLLKEMRRKIADFNSMACLTFCVDVAHAKYMADLFLANGIKAACVTGETRPEDRAATLRGLRDGTIQIVTSVDVFNEGLDVPSVNTIIMLRPTESPVVFLQQLGRGLRKAPGKSEVLVLDFIGAHRVQYRLDLKLGVLSGSPRGELLKNLDSGFPYLPSGVTISLDKIARENVLANIKSQIAPKLNTLVREIAEIGSSNLSVYLEKSAREPWEIYRLRKASWTALKAQAGLCGVSESSNLSSISKFLHVNDMERFEAYSRFVKPGLASWASVGERERRLRNMFFWHMWPDAQDKNNVRWTSVDAALAALADDADFSQEFCELMAFLKEKSRTPVSRTSFQKADIPLSTHANYSRFEILGASGYTWLGESELVAGGSNSYPESVSNAREGVQYIKDISLDVFFVTLSKGSKFSPSTRYLDYAVNESLFHWESQNKATVDSQTGRRYINQGTSKHDVLLCIRESADAEVRAQTFKVAGLADYVKHEGSAPIAVWWRLRTPLDLETYSVASAVRVA